MILVGHQAPDFTTTIVTEHNEIKKDVSLYDYVHKHHTLLFFYPLDFTFVCPTELIALDQAIDEFNARDIKVIAISVDSQFSHLAWKKTSIHEGGIGPVRFDMASDISHQICQMYGVEHFDKKVALRAAFIIDKQGIVRSQIVNDLPIGRNIHEILRTFDALSHAEQHGEVCPVNWHKGRPAMKESLQSVISYLEKNLHEMTS
ncbi:peroxiredoxin [bacterium]|jgi:peroxiredoxin (alkyl hydroperoxide reductase subunit C)|nr:peroxiredoxin [bacterium]NBW56336.1 peroxiredoxin [bacterium]NBX71981.1 peroxiredoxin [bacterium]